MVYHSPKPRAHGTRDLVLTPLELIDKIAALVPPPRAHRHRAVSRYLWAMLLARIYEAFPLACPICHAPMRIIAFINDADSVRKILNHIGESALPPRIAPARGSPWRI